MKKPVTLLTSAIFVALAAIPAIPAQNPIEFLPPGPSVLSGDDQLLTVDLPWPFRFLDDTFVTSLDISTNGIVFAGGTGSASATPSIAAFVTGPAAIAPLWDDLVASSVHFDTPYQGVAVVTWIATEKNGSGTPFTMQLRLQDRASSLELSSLPSGVLGNALVMIYDQDLPASNGLVGVTGGGGASPTLADLSSGGTASAGNGTVLQNFLGPPGSANDLQDRTIAVRYTPGLSGMVAALRSTSTSPEAEAFSFVGRRGCRPLVASLRLTQNAGGYAAQPNVANLDSDYLSGELVTAIEQGSPFASFPVATPFPVRMPGGTTTQTIYVHRNGRFSSDAAEPWSLPSVANLLQGAPMVCPMWISDPFFSLREWTIHYHQDSPTSFTITWRLPFAADTRTYLIQVRVLANGSFEFAYQLPDTLGGPIVGLSEGNGIADPFGTDLSFGGVQQSSGDVIYEDGQNLLLFDFPDRLNGDTSIILEGIPREPVLGTTLQARAYLPGVSFTPLALHVLGFPTAAGAPGLALGLLDASLARCDLWTDVLSPGSQPLTVAGQGTTNVATLPNLPDLVGVQLSLQALIFDSAITPTVLPTDELRLTLGR